MGQINLPAWNYPIRQAPARHIRLIQWGALIRRLAGQFALRFLFDCLRAGPLSVGKYCRPLTWISRWL